MPRLPQCKSLKSLLETRLENRLLGDPWLVTDTAGELDGATRAARRQPGSRSSTWRRRRARGAPVRERGPILASQRPTARFVVSWGDSAGALRVMTRCP